MRRVAKDENLHYLFYRDAMTAIFEHDPSTAVLAVEKQVRDFQMPGTGIPGFVEHAKAIADAGIYDFAIHHDKILQPVVLRDWKIESLEGLSPEAEQARDALVTQISRIGKIGHRLAEKRKPGRPVRPRANSSTPEYPSGAAMGAVRPSAVRRSCAVCADYASACRGWCTRAECSPRWKSPSLGAAASGPARPRRHRRRDAAPSSQVGAHPEDALAIDIAHLDRDLVVLSTTTMSPWRVGAWSPRASAVIEAEAGAFRRWGLKRGMQLEIRE